MKYAIHKVSTRYNFTDWIYGLVRLGYDHENDDYLTVTPTGTSYSYNSHHTGSQANLITSQMRKPLN